MQSSSTKIEPNRSVIKMVAKVVNIEVDTELWKQAKKEAVDRGITLKELLSASLRYVLDKKPALRL